MVGAREALHAQRHVHSTSPKRIKWNGVIMKSLKGQKDWQRVLKSLWERKRMEWGREKKDSEFHVRKATWCSLWGNQSLMLCALARHETFIEREILQKKFHDTSDDFRIPDQSIYGVPGRQTPLQVFSSMPTTNDLDSPLLSSLYRQGSETLDKFAEHGRHFSITIQRHDAFLLMGHSSRGSVYLLDP